MLINQLKNQYRRNATNVYLTNLAIADIFTLVFSKYFLVYEKDVKKTGKKWGRIDRRIDEDIWPICLPLA